MSDFEDEGEGEDDDDDDEEEAFWGDGVGKDVEMEGAA